MQVIARFSISYFNDLGNVPWGILYATGVNVKIHASTQVTTLNMLVDRRLTDEEIDKIVHMLKNYFEAFATEVQVLFLKQEEI